MAENGDAAGDWTLSQVDRASVMVKSGVNRLRFAVLLTFYRAHGRFPRAPEEIDSKAVTLVARQLGVEPENHNYIDMTSRTGKRHRTEIRFLLGFREATVADAAVLEVWLRDQIPTIGAIQDQLIALVETRCRELLIEAPTPDRIDRIVRAAIEGVVHHCTEMEIDRQYVDSHGQSTVAFAFCQLLGFQLMPRLKAIQVQKLSRPDAGQPDAYPNLWAILTRPIDWELIRQQCDQMVKYVTAVRLGTAETEAILRRFTRSNVQHPTYKAFSELGRAVKTIFLCRHLHSEELRREINEGLNVIEQWNSANNFIFFARRGEMVSNRREDHEISMLALHLLQNCMVYIDTLMLQRVPARPQWSGRLTARDVRALTPLIWEHVNPYGRFELDMETRLPVD
jgi:hypothetical protein